MSEMVDRVDERDDVLAAVTRQDAVRNRWLHRIAAIVCRDNEGRVLVHRRPDGVSAFPGGVNWLLGGGVALSESYESAAARELSEEVGVTGRPRFLFKFLCAGHISPYWLGVHEIEVPGPIRPCADEIAWHSWVTESELHDLVREDSFVPDARQAYERYRTLGERPLDPGRAPNVS